MQHTPKRRATRHDNSLACTVWEYGGIGTIDAADCVINGRYPETGFACNQISSMSIRSISGVDRLVTRQRTVTLAPGDVVLLPPNEPYYYEGDNLTFFMVCSPAWTPDQYVQCD